MKKKFTAVPKANQQANTRITAATNYKLIDKLVKDYEDDYVRGKALSVIWNEITKKHHDSKLARDVVAELEKGVRVFSARRGGKRSTAHQRFPFGKISRAQRKVLRKGYNFRRRNIIRMGEDTAFLHCVLRL